MDINEKKAFETGDYSHHNNFLDAVINGMEANMVNFTLWNYNPDNDNTYGDYWNGEDFSIFSTDNSPNPSPKKNDKKNEKKHSKTNSLSTRPKKLEKKLDKIETRGHQKSKSDLLTPSTPFEITSAYFHEGQRDHDQHIGGRALDAIIRPYATKVAGTPIKTLFKLSTLQYQLRFSTSPKKLTEIEKTSEIFIPNYHYGNRTVKITVSDGTIDYDKEHQTIRWVYNQEWMGNVVDDLIVHELLIDVGVVSRRGVSKWWEVVFWAGLVLLVGLVYATFDKIDF